jgi:hypothetical protein
MKMSDLWKKHGFLLLAALVVIIVIVVSVSVAKAAGTSTTVSWLNPTAYVDGSDLDAADIKETVLTWRRPGRTAIVGTSRVAAPATQTVVTGLTCGSFAFTLVTVMTTGATSADSAAVTYSSGILCAPNSPTNLKVT